MPHSRSPAAPSTAAALMAACLVVGSVTAPAAAQSAPPQQQAALPPGATAPTSARTSTMAPARGAPAASGEVVPLRSLLGRAVVDPSDAVVAVVQDFVLDPATGRAHAVLAVSGRSRLVAVPTPALRLREDGSLLVNADRTALLAMPSVEAPALAEASGTTGGPLLSPALPGSPRPVPLTPSR